MDDEPKSSHGVQSLEIGIDVLKVLVGRKTAVRPVVPRTTVGAVVIGPVKVNPPLPDHLNAAVPVRPAVVIWICRTIDPSVG